MLEFYQIVWFVLVAVLIAGYAVLDGFDLGVGFWYLFEKEDAPKQKLIKSIGPVWDGNEVWLLTGGGAIFAAFPDVYATVFSGFYLPFMLVIFALIFRAVSIEFRNKEEAPSWRKKWDVAFSVGSIIPALLYGVAVGNILRGLQLDERMTYTGGFFALLNPYALLIGLTGFAMFLVQGALYAALKTPEPLEGRMQARAKIGWFAYLALFLIASAATFIWEPQLLANYQNAPALYAIPTLALAAIVLIGAFIFMKAFGKAFIASSLSIVLLVAVCAASLFPNMTPALGDAALSLTIWSHSSSEITLKMMFIIAAIGMPLVIGYTIWVYHTFKGKVRLEEEGY